MSALAQVVEHIDAAIAASNGVQSDDLPVGLAMSIGFALHELLVVRQALVAAEGRL